MGTDTEAAEALMRAEDGWGVEDPEAVTTVPPAISLAFRRGIVASTAIAAVLLVCSLRPHFRGTQLPETALTNIKGLYHTAKGLDIAVCSNTAKHGCPKSYGKTGGFHCKTHKGCRSKDDGAFPADNCKAKDQCYIQPTVQAPAIQACSNKVEHQCPKTYRKSGGFHCTTHKGCRASSDGPFPIKNCKAEDQCYIKPEDADKSGSDEAGGGTAGSDEAGDDEAGDDETGDDEAGNDEAGSDEAGSDEAGDDEAGGDEAGGDEAGDDGAGSDHAGSDEAGSDHAGSDHAGDDHADSDAAGSDHAGSDHAGDDHAGSDEAGSDHAGHDDAGSDEAGSDKAGSDLTGPQ